MQISAEKRQKSAVSRIEVFITAVMQDMTIGHIMSLIIHTGIPFTPQDLDFMSWMTLITSASLPSKKSKEVQFSSSG